MMMPMSEPGPMEEPTDEEMRAYRDGPVAAANKVLGLLKEGQYEDAWPLTDPEWRLGRLQTWLWLNRGYFASHDLDAEAAAGVTDTPERWWWPAFALMDGRMWQEAVHFDRSTWGEAPSPSLIDPEYVKALFVQTGGRPAWGDVRTLSADSDDQGRLWLKPPDGTPVLVPDLIEVLMHYVDRRWLVASINQLRYQPGWPPTFIDGSPLA